MAMKVPKMTTLRTDHLSFLDSKGDISSDPEARIPEPILQQAACQEFNHINVIQPLILRPWRQYPIFDDFIETLGKNSYHFQKLKAACLRAGMANFLDFRLFPSSSIFSDPPTC
jgi:hypothetical protein